MFQLFPKRKPLPIKIKFAVGANKTAIVISSSDPDIKDLLDGDTLEFVDNVPSIPGVYKAYLNINSYVSNNWDSPEYDVDYSLHKVIKLKIR